MKATEITEDNLEDLLTYDDTFLEFFNAFLALPAFPQALQYNRLTGTFQEVEGSVNSIAGSVIMPERAIPYGATDDERENMLEWCKTERLPCFLRTQLFRELKLCKLLIRQLDEQHSASRVSSRALRGYSRASESYMSSLSNSADNSANEDDSEYEDDGVWGADVDKSALYKYERPGSRALSLPPKLGLDSIESSSTGAESIRSNQKTKSALTKNRENTNLSIPVPKTQQTLGGLTSESGLGTSLATGTENTFVREPTFTTRNDTLLSTNIENGHSKNDNVKNNSDKTKRSTKTSDDSRQRRKVKHKRAISAPVNYNEFLRLPTQYSEFDLIFGEDEPGVDSQAFVSFDEEVVSEQQTETDMKQLEGKHHMSMQQMKETLLSSLAGLESFKEFLINTNGESLLNFWLDCEHFKNSMVDNDEFENMAIRNKLFRNIQDTYKMTLTEDAKNQIRRISNDTGLSHTIFLRTQYDVLRRFRSYWIPRFLIHKEHIGELQINDSKHKETALKLIPEVWTSSRLTQSQDSSSFLPSISFVNSMPVKPEDVLHIATTKSWDMVSKGGRRLDERITSAKPWESRPQTFINTSRTIKDKIALALGYDQVAGGPFRVHLESHGDNEELLANLLFWQEVTEYGQAQSRDADRLLRMTRAWTIFNRYLAIGSRYNIGMQTKFRDIIHHILLTSRDFVDASIFDPAKVHAVDTLERVWIRFLKEDLKKFLDCHIWKEDDEAPPSTAEDIEVLVMRERVIVRRPWVRRYPPSTCSARGRRLKTALSVAESIDLAKRAEQKKKAKERRQAMEKERKKAVKAAYKRQRESKMKTKVFFKKPQQQQQQQQEEEGDNGGASPQPKSAMSRRTDGITPAPEEDKPVTFADQKDNKPMISLFKKYLTDNEGKESLHLVNLYSDIDSYNDLGTQKQKKEIQASFIHKTYIENGAKKYVKLTDRLYARLNVEKGRPRSPTLHETQKVLGTQLTEHFQTFFKLQAEEFGVDEKTLAHMSQAELAMRTESDASLMKSFGGNAKNKSGKSIKKENTAVISRITKLVLPNLKPHQKKMVRFEEEDKRVNNARATNPSLVLPNIMLQTLRVIKNRKKNSGRAQPTKEDKVSFLAALSDASGGQLGIQMLYFYKYLVKHGEEDGFPNIDKDIFFYIEVQKFKDLSHAFGNEDLLTKKCQAIVDCFLESAAAPSCQIDIATDMCMRIIRNAQRYTQGKEITPTVFDEPQYVVFKELLPYWAGFCRTYKSPEDPTKLPVTKTQRMLRKRLEEFNAMPEPKKEFTLPALTTTGAKIAAFTFTITDGIMIRESNTEELVSETLLLVETPESGRRSLASRSRKSTQFGVHQKLQEIKEVA